MQIKRNLFLGITGIGVVLFFISVWSCRNAATTDYKTTIGYDLENPNVILELPLVLREISGITLVDSATIACIQDENGIVFLYDILQNKITSQSVFYGNGDYEGICHVDTTIFVLRSDGALFEISNYESTVFKVNVYPTVIPGSNNEGLCYDKPNQRLLIARKNKIAKGKEFKNKRAIYAFDLKTKALDPEPVFEFDVDSIRKMASEEKMIPALKEKKEKKKDKIAQPLIRFASSEIAIHPITHKLFLLSSSDHLLFIINEKGIVEHIAELNPKIFKQPEGIAFQKNGDMLITNEGQHKNSTLLQFKYR
jgi:uncharacterized protein YjiK